ncbi:MAG: ribosome assembly RNA-binding protein YhbY [Mariprofundaceae bacterium]|nr:ribosome assembly RNA-binding protein YhbY [Mariprofundaceae bacterium]
MPVNSRQRKELKAAAHHLKPVIRIGQHGVSEGVIAETDISLNTHELIKVHVQQGERNERLAAVEKLCQQVSAELIHHIGKVFIIYRKRQESANKTFAPHDVKHRSQAKKASSAHLFHVKAKK